MFSHVEQALRHLATALDAIDAAPSDQLRRVLGLSKQLRSRVELLETRAAAAVARRERHGDGGAGLLREHSGLSRSDAARNVRTGAEMAAIPDACAGVAEGQISLENAARLARAARKTSPDAVQGDPGLIGLAKTLPADEFAQAARRWEAQNQDAADLAAQQRRNRRDRHVRFWNGDDGSVQMRASFDTETGARIAHRLRHQAEQLRQADRRRAHNHNSSASDGASDNGGIGAGDAEKRTTDQRTTDQRMADALDTLLAAGSAAQPALGTAAAPADRTPPAGPADQQPHTSTEPSPAVASSAPGGRKAAEIVVRADLAALTNQPGGFAEICGVGPIAPSTLARLACNSDVWIEIFGDTLTPLYEAVARRAPTAAQRRALIARDGACIGCAAPPGDCEAHHVFPWKCGGKTRIDNLVLVCWSCHDHIHDHNWHVTTRHGRFRLMAPDPEKPPNPAPSRKPKHPTPHQPPAAATPQQPSAAATPRQTPAALWEPQQTQPAA